MKTEWILDTIYPGINTTEYENDVIKLKQVITSLNDFACETITSELSLKDKLEKYIELNSGFSKLRIQFDFNPMNIF